MNLITEKLDGADVIISIQSDMPPLFKPVTILKKMRKLAVDALGYKSVDRILYPKKCPMGYFKFWIGGQAGNNPSFLFQYPGFVTFADSNGYISQTTLEDFKIFMQGYKDLKV